MICSTSFLSVSAIYGRRTHSTKKAYCSLKIYEFDTEFVVYCSVYKSRLKLIDTIHMKNLKTFVYTNEGGRVRQCIGYTG